MSQSSISSKVSALANISKGIFTVLSAIITTYNDYNRFNLQIVLHTIVYTGTNNDLY
jgi:hypothetical protein